MENLKYPVIGCVERIGMLRMEGLQYTAISRKVAGKKIEQSTMPKGNIGHDQYKINK